MLCYGYILAKLKAGVNYAKIKININILASYPQRTKKSAVGIRRTG